jgi:hypothetical protein
MNETGARASLTKICLKYLSHLPGECPLEQTTLYFPLTMYSAQYWLDHAKLAESLNDVQGAVLRFFEQKEAFQVSVRLFDPDYRGFVRPQNQEMGPPLYYTSLSGLQRVTELLLQRGADINAQGGRFSNALQAASAYGRKEIVQILLNQEQMPMHRAEIMALLSRQLLLEVTRRSWRCCLRKKPMLICMAEITAILSR